MAWTTPLTAVANVSLTSVQWNATVRDNLLETGPAKATTGGRILVTTGANAIAERDVTGAFTGATGITNSASYIPLTGGPAVTITTGTKALVTIGCYTRNDTATGRNWMSHAISGASTAAASDAYALMTTSPVANELYGYSQLTLWTTLTAGSNTFTANYKVSVAGIGTWIQRRVIVMGL